MTCIYYHIIGGLSRPFFKVLRFFTYAPQRTQLICKQISCIYRPFGQSAVTRYSGFGYYISVYFRRCLSQSNIYGLAARKILNLFKRCIGHRLKPQNSFISPVNRECAVRYQCKIRRCVFADIILNIRRPDEAPYQSRFSAGRSLCIPKPPHTPCLRLRPNRWDFYRLFQRTYHFIFVRLHIIMYFFFISHLFCTVLSIISSRILSLSLTK